jgi:hypothetical protein
MTETKSRVQGTIELLEQTITSVPEEKQEEVRLFLEGYLAALEQEVRKRA